MPTFTLPESPRYLVALSGGADSRLLLELTVRALSSRDGEGRVVAAHLHHGIRGEEADRDEAFCTRISAELGVPLIIEHADVPALAHLSGESIETAARRVRYDFLIGIMARENIPTLLTAHHADDNLETVIDRLLRGSGTRGMGGIPPTRDLGASLPDGTPLTVARPLLSWTRADVTNALAEAGLDYVTDSSNLEDAHTRNRIRHTVTPLLEDIAGKGVPQRSALRLSRAAREDEEALTAIATRAYETAQVDGHLPVAAVASEMPAVAKRMIHRAWQAYWQGRVPSEHTLSAHHLEAILALCREGQSGDVSDLLCDNVRAELRDGLLIFQAPASPSLRQDLRPLGEGLTAWDEEISIRTERSDSPLAPLSGDGVLASAVFPLDKLPLPLYARSRASGDLILSHGMTKKLKKLLCDKDVPLHLRDRIPLILLPDGETPLWYPTAAFRDGYQAPRDGASLRITVYLTRTRSL